MGRPPTSGTHPTEMLSCYCLQRSWGKVIFSEACVKNSVHIPPEAVHAGRYGQQAGGTHPTRMHTCCQLFRDTIKFRPLIIDDKIECTNKQITKRRPLRI